MWTWSDRASVVHFCYTLPLLVWIFSDLLHRCLSESCISPHPKFPLFLIKMACPSLSPFSFRVRGEALSDPCHENCHIFFFMSDISWKIQSSNTKLFIYDITLHYITYRVQSINHVYRFYLSKKILSVILLIVISDVE